MARRQILSLAERESLLALKGLEGEVAVITSPEEMDAQHLYVAMTRGASRLVVCSLTPILAAR